LLGHDLVDRHLNRLDNIWRRPWSSLMLRAFSDKYMKKKLLASSGLRAVNSWGPGIQPLHFLGVEERNL
jgi:hypothetical protein